MNIYEKVYWIFLALFLSAIISWSIAINELYKHKSNLKDVLNNKDSVDVWKKYATDTDSNWAGYAISVILWTIYIVGGLYMIYELWNIRKVSKMNTSTFDVKYKFKSCLNK